MLLKYLLWNNCFTCLYGTLSLMIILYWKQIFLSQHCNNDLFRDEKPNVKQLNFTTFDFVASVEEWNETTNTYTYKHNLLVATSSQFLLIGLRIRFGIIPICVNVTVCLVYICILMQILQDPLNYLLSCCFSCLSDKKNWKWAVFCWRSSSLSLDGVKKNWEKQQKLLSPTHRR